MTHSRSKQASKQASKQVWPDIHLQASSPIEPSLKIECGLNPLALKHYHGRITNRSTRLRSPITARTGGKLAGDPNRYFFPFLSLLYCTGEHTGLGSKGFPLSSVASR